MSLVEICALPFVDDYQTGINVQREINLHKNNFVFYGDMKSLVYIASRKWIYSYQDALHVYETSNIRLDVFDDDNEYETQRMIRCRNKYLRFKSKKSFLNTCNHFLRSRRFC